MRQVDLASKAGVSIQTVLRAEKSGHWPRSVAIRRAYLAALGLTEDAIDGAATVRGGR